ncbi:DeoR/GlpR family DNA-binding transcription regulator [Desulfosarcina ovata]|uniref:DeoR family transcriptional regulator n=1 Tax=Desulfosarcina ovata subsp. ovata TaxID=2752305 RepID=A0A5K8AB02_9BACT|nr:DeoR/GlpR family DNA-binding transcription regulator [Desulfosarcina ovata]BBO89711.1 DeoR family transcriptional regulator [Desulfosarcina ovata subsp. ovata]
MANKKTLRQNEIITLLRESPAMRVNELAGTLNVTAETIRRDLDEMTEKGLLERTYGGAILRLEQEPGINVRHSLLVREREAIARQTVKEIKGASHLMIGSGATTVHVARYIAAEMSNLTVIVHSFGVAIELVHNPTIRVLMAPGVYSPTEGANHGEHTLRFLEKFWVDYTIVSASGLSLEGPCDALIDAGEVYATMMSRAFQTVLTADQSKFNLKFPARFAYWGEVDLLVTDARPTDRLATMLERHGVNLRVAPPRPF